MPSDFVARWLSFMGRIAITTSELGEPEDSEDRTHYRLVLGIASLLVIILSIVAYATSVDNWAGTLKALQGPVSEEWFTSITAISILAVILVLAVPQGVGLLYGFRHRRPSLYFPVSLGVPFVVLVAAILLRAPGLMFLSVAPMFLSFCPTIPGKEAPPRRRK